MAPTQYSCPYPWTEPVPGVKSWTRLKHLTRIHVQYRAGGSAKGLPHSDSSLFKTALHAGPVIPCCLRYSSLTPKETETPEKKSSGQVDTVISRLRAEASRLHPGPRPPQPCGAFPVRPSGPDCWFPGGSGSRSCLNRESAQPHQGEVLRLQARLWGGMVPLLSFLQNPFALSGSPQGSSSSHTGGLSTSRRLAHLRLSMDKEGASCPPLPQDSVSPALGWTSMCVHQRSTEEAVPLLRPVGRPHGQS